MRVRWPIWARSIWPKSTLYKLVGAAQEATLTARTTVAVAQARSTTERLRGDPAATLQSLPPLAEADTLWHNFDPTSRAATEAAGWMARADPAP